METRVFERDGKTWTRFKVKVKELRIYARLLKKWVDIENRLNRVVGTYILRLRVICSIIKI